MARSRLELPLRDPVFHVQHEASAEHPRTFHNEDGPQTSANTEPVDASGAIAVIHPEFLPPPGCFPAYKFGPELMVFGQEGSNKSRYFDSACHSIGPAALNNTALFLNRRGMFDHLLYNYLFMCTVNKELAVLGLHQKSREMPTLSDIHMF
ncbi:hypothetical protein CEUSTIGMA_g4739.t1 [Chlamydomonas eustigma]|uniref:Uncharacterized protein n=1 Tax=Chlamydomonas eustigma TaxID=1157962 RepID=A0A250X2H3_9CHLO|nr:hypothetical protein CEUSTIGMA_g4739.t1 [Chlamydomonas eustigma]|eukprot:GAX77293.1 hypothetical protein CEUSTIGMA_g4739.t1 [Chlamydomonas eustigma]